MLQEILSFLDCHVDESVLQGVWGIMWDWQQKHQLPPDAPNKGRKYVEGWEDALWAVTGDWTGGYDAYMNKEVFK